MKNSLFSAQYEKRRNMRMQQGEREKDGKGLDDRKRRS